MSGHSKWSTIKRKKEKTDNARAKVFTKIGREIAVAVKSGGPDPAANSKLKDVIAKAKANNVPNDNIERIIKKASGDGNADAYNVSYTTSDCVLFWQGSARYDEPLSSSVTGGGQPTLMCKNYLAEIYADEKPQDFIVPQGIAEVKLDKLAYEDGNLVIASDNAPSAYVVSDIFDARYVPDQRDTSFDYPSANSFEATTDGDKVTIRFTADPHICYKVIKKSLFTDDKIVSEVKNQSGTITVEDTADGIFGYNRYVVVPYYIDDDGRETIGEIYQIPVGW